MDCSAAASPGAMPPPPAASAIRRQSSLPKIPVAAASPHARMQAFATVSPVSYTSSSFARSSSVPEAASSLTSPGSPSSPASSPSTSSGGLQLGTIPKNRDKQMETRKKQLETLKVTHLFIAHFFWSENFNVATGTFKKDSILHIHFLKLSFTLWHHFFLTLRVTNFDSKQLHYFNDRVVLCIFLP